MLYGKTVDCNQQQLLFGFMAAAGAGITNTTRFRVDGGNRAGMASLSILLYIRPLPLSVKYWSCLEAIAQVLQLGYLSL